MSIESPSWTYTLPDDGRVRPEHLVDLLWDWQQHLISTHAYHALARWRSKEQLANFVDPAFQASLYSDEGRQVRFRVAFLLTPFQITVPFLGPRAFSASELVKLAPVIGIGSRWIVARPDPSSSDEIQIEGILDPDILPVLRTHQKHGRRLDIQSLAHGLYLSVLGPGWVRLSSYLDGFEIRNCSIRQRLLIGNIKYVREFFSDVSKQVGHDSGYLLASNFLINVLARISEARHGGCILVLPQESDLTSLPIQIKYQTDTDRVLATITALASVGPKAWIKGKPPEGDGPVEVIHDDSTVPDLLMLQQDLAHVSDCVAALASVDGAVLLTRELRILGFGAELLHTEYPTKDERVEFGTHPSPFGKPEPISLLNFGMRHRSAVRFCQRVPGALAFVVSQDGGIRLFHNVDGTVRQFVDLTAEEW